MPNSSQPNTLTSSKKSQNSGPASIKYVGFVDTCNDKIISGWGIKVVGNEISTTQVTIISGKEKHEVFAGGFRQDLYDKAGINFGHFSLNLSGISKNIPPSVLFEDGTEVPMTSEARNPIRAEIDNDYDAFISGWAASYHNIAPKISIYCDDELVAETFATGFREDLLQAGLNKGYAAFRCRIPAIFRGRPNVRTRIEADGVEIYSELRSYSPFSVLIVSETERLDDASRYYRCDNLRHLLQAEKFDATVIGANEFGAKAWAHVDAIVFARCGADTGTFDKIKKYKEDYGIKVIYEIDDLVFLPWHTSDLGSVRSGVDNADNPNLINMFARRLRLIMMADGAITTTSKIAGHLSEMGLPCMLIPNMVRPHEISPRTQPTEGPLRILCMSGSATHYKDFQDIEQILVKLLRRHGASIELTLLGNFREGQQILGLSNVKHIPRVPYPKMLQLIDKSDICVVPLEFTAFNDAKSCLKYIECGARGVPVLASATADYRRVINNEVNGFIAEDLNDWSKYLEAFASRKYDLHNIGLAAQQDVSQNFNLETANPNLRQFFNGI